MILFYMLFYMLITQHRESKTLHIKLMSNIKSLCCPAVPRGEELQSDGQIDCHIQLRRRPVSLQHDCRNAWVARIQFVLSSALPLLLSACSRWSAVDFHIRDKLNWMYKIVLIQVQVVSIDSNRFFALCYCIILHNFLIWFKNRIETLITKQIVIRKQMHICIFVLASYVNEQ